MKRRELLGAMGATLVPFGSLAHARHAPVRASGWAGGKIVLGDSFFLSKTNPVATADQRALEARALELMKEPAIIAAKHQAGERFKILANMKFPAEALIGYDAKMEQWAYHYILLALNSDPNYPKVVGNEYGAPHVWFGMNVPGTRGPGTAECVDNAYAMVPIDGSAHFELHGLVIQPAVRDTVFATTASLSQGTNVNVLDGRHLVVEEDGSYVLTVGPEPANGRKNHLQTAPDAQWLFIRNSRVDWKERPHALRVKRIDPPFAAPRSREDVIAVATRYIVDDVPANFWFMQMVNVLPPNQVVGPQNSGDVGGTAVQMLARFKLELADDEAFVVTLKPGGSGYFNIIAHDFWFMTLDYWARTSTLNNTQSDANPDGSYTYVISSRDPGIYNWIDTQGLHETKYLIRFRLLPETSARIALPTGGAAAAAPGGSPEVAGQKINLVDLDKAIAPHVKRVTPAQRKQQLADRLADFRTRFEV